jgi:hypothetical protein
MANASDYTSKYLILVRYPDRPQWVWLQRQTAIVLSPDFYSEEEAVRWIDEEMGPNPYLEHEEQLRKEAEVRRILRDRRMRGNNNRDEEE